MRTEKQHDELLAFILKWRDALKGHPNVPAFQAPWAADFIREAETLIDQAAEKAGVPSPPKA